MPLTMKPTLLVLAAGMGSRYGGLKQLAPVGRYGEGVIDLLASDAYAAGFEDIVMRCLHKKPECRYPSALALAEEGATIILTGRRRDPLESVAARIRQGNASQGGIAHVQPADLTVLAEQYLREADIPETEWDGRRFHWGGVIESPPFKGMTCFITEKEPGAHENTGEFAGLTVARS